MNKGELKIFKQSIYKVSYSTQIPQGADASITYTGEDGFEQMLKHVTGSWTKTVTLTSGQAAYLKINTKLPKTDPAGKLATIIQVNNEVISQQTQTGRNVHYRLAFKLP